MHHWKVCLLFNNVHIFFIYILLFSSPELNRLWNVRPDNMAACRAKERDFLPTLESYFEEAIEQLDPSVESQYKCVRCNVEALFSLHPFSFSLSLSYRRVNEGNFGWRALRLLSRRSSHFFTHGNTTIARLPEYLETHVKRLAATMQVNSILVVLIKSRLPL